jgi:hypothetical protein
MIVRDNAKLINKWEIDKISGLTDEAEKRVT